MRLAEKLDWKGLMCVCPYLLFQQTFTHQIYIICHENLIYTLGSHLQTPGKSVAVLEQQEVGQTVDLVLILRALCLICSWSVPVCMAVLYWCFYTEWATKK
jgi:hypothetical protein